VATESGEEAVAVGVSVLGTTVALGVRVGGRLVAVSVGVSVTVAVLLAVGEGVRLGVKVGVTVGVLVGVSVGVRVGGTNWVGVDCRVAVAVPGGLVSVIVGGKEVLVTSLGSGRLVTVAARGGVAVAAR
jgi:NF-X1-type zinc finger protein NFXL1